MRRILLVALGALAACAASATVEPIPSAGFGAGTTSYLAPASVADSAPAVPSASPPEDSIGSSVTAASVTGASALARPAEATSLPSNKAVVVASPDGDALRQRERLLRDSLRGPEPVTAALDLAALLCDLERHREAARLLKRTSTDTGDPVLAVALASVHRDLGQRHLAVAGLRGLRREQGALSLHPGLLFELAELEWLEGEGDAARQTLVELRRAHGKDPWIQANRKSLQALEKEIDTAAVPRLVAVRDLIGNLRGAPSPAVRLRTFDELVVIVRDRDTAPAVRALHRRILAIGAGDESAAVRARAVQMGPGPLIEPDETRTVAFVRAGLQDAAPFVRRVACRRAVELLAKAASPLLFAGLAEELDAETFRAFDAGLAELHGGPVVEGGFDADDPAARTAIVTAWRVRGRELKWIN